MDAPWSVPALARPPAVRVAPRPPLRIRLPDPPAAAGGGAGAGPALSRGAMVGSAVLHAAIVAGLLQVTFAGRRAPERPSETVSALYLGEWTPPAAPPVPPDPPVPAEPPRVAEAIPASPELPAPVVARADIPVIVPPPVPPAETPPAPAPAAPVRVSRPTVPAPVPEARPDFDAIRTAIYRQLVYPAAARRRGEEGRVLLVLTIGAGGILQEVVAQAGSASSRLVQAALAAARRAAPFPDAAAGQYRVPIVFRLASSAELRRP